MSLRPLSFAAAVGATIALAGCGTSGDPKQTVLAAVRNTLSLSADADLTLRGASVFGPVHAPVQTRSAFAFVSGLGYEAVQLPALGDGQPAGTTYLDFVPARVYVQPAVQSALPKGRVWIEVPFGPGSDARTPRLAEVLEGLNPQFVLEQVAVGAVSASSLGGRVINHVPFTEYRVSVDLERARAALSREFGGAMSAAAAEELAAERAAGRGATVNVELWVDGSGRVARLESSPPGSGLGAVVMALDNFGVSFPRSLPLASQSVQLGALRPPNAAPALSWLFRGGG